MAGMNLKDWNAMSPEEQQKYFDSIKDDYITRRDLMTIPGISLEHIITTSPLPHESPVKFTNCSEGLKQLRAQLLKEVPDEESASKMYRELALKFEPEDISSANSLVLISEQEMLHKKILEGIIKEITDTCES